MSENTTTYDPFKTEELKAEKEVEAAEERREELRRRGWEEEERVREQREEVTRTEKEQRDKLYPQHTVTRPTETENGSPFYKTHQEQQLWMAQDEKYGRATYNRPAKKLTTLEKRNLESELKDIEGSIQELVNRFKLYEARKVEIEQMLGIN